MFLLVFPCYFRHLLVFLLQKDNLMDPLQQDILFLHLKGIENQKS